MEISERAKQLLVRIGTMAIASLIAIAIVSCVLHYRQQLVLLNDIHWGLLVGAFAGAVLYRITNAHGWSMVLKAIGNPLAPLTALRIWLLSEACRWLPGSVWSYGSRALQAKRSGIPSVPAGSSLFLELALTILAWCVTAVVGLVGFHSVYADWFAQVPIRSIWIGTIATVAVSIVAACFAGLIRRKIANKWKALATHIRNVSKMTIDRGRVAKVFVYYVVMCFFNGVTYYVVIKAIVPDVDVPLLAVIGANAAAWLVGFFAFMAPGGLVVREGALAALLAIWLPVEVATASAIVWRLIQIATEVLCMLAAASPGISRSFRRQQRPSASRATSQTGTLPNVSASKSTK